MKKILIGVIASLSALVAGCNTMGGMGKDIQAGGKAVEDAAERK